MRYLPLILLAAGALFFALRNDPPHPPAPTDLSAADPAATFQRAFWKRPAADDRILHAARREWKDAQGTPQWQWFLAVQPSPALTRHIREDNAFGLIPATDAAPPADAPEWFHTGGCELSHAAAGNLRLYFATDQTLYATGTGGEFRAGAPAPAAVPRGRLTQAGRLPVQPPPSQP